MKIKLRKIKKSDLSELSNLGKEYGRVMIKVAEKTIKGFGNFENPIMDRNYFRRAFNRKSKLFLVAIDNKKIIGFILARIVYHRETNKIYPEGKLSEIFITNKYRGKGIAELMWREALKWFKKKKVKFVQLHVFYGNETPIAIYRKWGFKPMGLIMKTKLK